MVTSQWGSWFYGNFPLGKLVSGLLPAEGEGGLHVYSLLGEWVCEVIICKCNSCLSVLLCFFLWLFCLPVVFLFPLLYSYYYLNSFLCLHRSSMLSGLELYCSNFLSWFCYPFFFCYLVSS